jgi:hypothetical protein
LFGGVYKIALANAVITVFSAAPVFKVFYKNLIIYFASSFEASCKSFIIIDSFMFVELSPDELAILLNSLKT